MRKVFLLIFALPLILSSCEELEKIKKKDRKIAEEKKNNPPPLPTLYLHRRVFEGHQYLYMRGFREYSFIHDPDCPCKKKEIQ